MAKRAGSGPTAAHLHARPDLEPIMPSYALDAIASTAAVGGLSAPPPPPSPRRRPDATSPMGSRSGLRRSRSARGRSALRADTPHRRTRAGGHPSRTRGGADKTALVQTQRIAASNPRRIATPPRAQADIVQDADGGALADGARQVAQACAACARGEATPCLARRRPSAVRWLELAAAGARRDGCSVGRTLAGRPTAATTPPPPVRTKSAPTAALERARSAARPRLRKR